MMYRMASPSQSEGNLSLSMLMAMSVSNYIAASHTYSHTPDQLQVA